MSWAFLVSAFLVVLMPGTGVLYTLAVGFSQGFRASVAAALGCTLGIVPAALASIVGLAALFHTSALAYQLIKYAGAAYLLYLAWRTWRDNSGFEVQDAQRQTLWAIARNACLINVLNPKLSLFFMAFLPQFVDTQDAQVTFAIAKLAGVFMLMTLLVFIGYGALASQLKRQIAARPSLIRWIKNSFALTLSYLGLRLAFSK